MNDFSRRNFLRTAGVGGGVMASGIAGGAYAEEERRARAKDPKFLIVLTSFGGASLTDSFMTVRESECATPATLNAYPDSVVSTVGNFRSVDMKGPRIGAIPIPYAGNQTEFVKKHGSEMMVTTHTGTSVNHFVAQQRSINGNGAWQGRTLQEAVALTYGDGYAIPNVHMVNGTGFTERGTDTRLPSYAYGERAPTPNLWPLSLDGYQGVKGAPSRELFEAARRLRNTKLDPGSDFFRTFGGADRIKNWTGLRGKSLQGIEAADLITKLMVFPDSETMPLASHGLKGSDLAQKVRTAFPNYDFDPLESQAALAFLLLRYGVSVTVTIGPEGSAVFRKGMSLTSGPLLREGDLLNTPISFDFSHSASRETQSMMWDRQLKVADKLITLLKGEEFGEGKSYWDHSMIYFATEFGRTRNRPKDAVSFGTSHDLNNGNLFISPLVNGGKVLGGVDPNTILTYGFDPATGAPQKGRQMKEPEIYAGIVQALGVDTSGSGLTDMRAMRKTA